MQDRGARVRREANSVPSTVDDSRGRLFVANPDASSDSDEDELGLATPVSTPNPSAIYRRASLPPSAAPGAPAKTGSGGRLTWTVDNTLHPNDYLTLELGQVGMAY